MTNENQIIEKDYFIKYNLEDNTEGTIIKFFAELVGEENSKLLKFNVRYSYTGDYRYKFGVSSKTYPRKCDKKIYIKLNKIILAKDIKKIRTKLFEIIEIIKADDIIKDKLKQAKDETIKIINEKIIPNLPDELKQCFNITEECDSKIINEKAEIIKFITIERMNKYSSGTRYTIFYNIDTKEETQLYFSDISIGSLNNNTDSILQKRIKEEYGNFLSFVESANEIKKILEILNNVL